MLRSHVLAGVLLTPLSLAAWPRSTAAAGKEPAVNPVNERFGRLNPKAPPELSRFAFLVGRWRCDARAKTAEGGAQSFQATWAGRFILDGYAIEDEYRMTDSTGALIVLGLNFRVYDVIQHTWNIKWLHALTGTWVDLGPKELGGVRFDGSSISYAFKEPMAGHGYSRATYTNVSRTHFTWRGEKSDDAKTWSEFMVIECHRVE